jgi:hypothetical protein
MSVTTGQHNHITVNFTIHWDIMYIDLYLFLESTWPITAAARTKSRNVFARSNTAIMGSNSTQGMNVYVYSVYALSCVGSGFAKGRSLLQGVLPTVCKIHKIRINSDRAEAREPNLSK